MTSRPGRGATADVVVVGSGIAGLTAALAVGEGARVAVVTKGALDEGCSRWAQGGIAAAVGPDDAPEVHLEDTLAAGRGLCDERAVRVLVEEGPARIRQLVEWGVDFDTQDGEALLGREAAHTRARILHARGDATGLEIESALIGRLRARAAEVHEHHHVTRLLVEDGSCTGVEVHDALTGRVRAIAARAVILASGGAGQLWRWTTNPPPATGDGIALAYEAGAEVAGMEFVQFHPTALAVAGAPRFLISEAVRGEGAHIVDSAGERFLFAIDPRGELAPRDVVAQAIWSRLRDGGEQSVFLDCRALGRRAALRFPTIHRTCLTAGIDITRDPVPVAPAAHYLIGGVRTDLDARTSVGGLFACGEVASSGVHGANRLASNSLLESVVFAQRAARAAVGACAEAPPPAPAGCERHAPIPAGRDIERWWEDLRDAMWRGAGVVRDAEGLRECAAVTDRVIDACGDEASLAATRLRHAAQCARLVCAAALTREESRGAHLRSDFPTLDDTTWHGSLVMRRDRGAHLVRNP